MEEMALAYVARFATSAGKLADYLRRKLRERGWEGDAQADIPALIERFVDVGYVDDAGYARAKGQGLLRRGYGIRRIDQALTQAGISEEHREDTRGDMAERRHAALTMARKRRFGPFGPNGGPTDRAACEKQVAALLRAGHPLEYARRLVNAATIAAAEEWVDEEQD
jgi:regulatory protein